MQDLIKQYNTTLSQLREAQKDALFLRMDEKDEKTRKS